MSTSEIAEYPRETPIKWKASEFSLIFLRRALRRELATIDGPSAWRDGVLKVKKLSDDVASDPCLGSMTMPPNTSQWKQPKGVYLLAFSDFWERLSYTGIVALLVIFLTSRRAEGGLGWQPETALRVLGLFTGAAFGLPPLGGWISDRWLGERKAVLMGGTGILAGNIVIFALDPRMPSATSTMLLYAGLAAIALSTGLMKPAIGALVGRIYDEQPHLPRSAGYTVFLMCIYLGSIVGPIVSGAFGELGTFKWGFLVAALGMMVGLISFAVMAPRLLGTIGTKPHGRDQSGVATKTAPQHKRYAILAIAVMTLFAALYNTAFYQKAGVVSLMIKSSTARTVEGVEIPAASFMSITAIGFFIVAPIIETVTNRLSRRSIYVDPFSRQALALIMLAVGFVFLTSAAAISSGIPMKQHSLWWIVAAYLCFSCGEALTWPVQLSTISRIAPPGLTSALIGMFYVAIGVGTALAGIVGVYAQQLGLIRYFLAIQLVLILGSASLMFIRWANPALRRIVSVDPRS